MKEVRINVMMSEDLRKRLDTLKKDYGASTLSQVVRNALTLLELAVKKNREGAKILIEYPDGTLTEIDITPKKGS